MPASRSSDTTVVLGLGNVLWGDDGLGPTVVRGLLDRYDLPDDVEAHDLGTPGFDLVPFLADRPAVVLVDVVRDAGPAGTVRCYDRDAVVGCSPHLRMSPHEPTLAQALFALALADRSPGELHLVGVVPARVEQGVGLSDALLQSVPVAEALVVALLLHLGHDVRQRRRPRTHTSWWSAPTPMPARAR